MPYSETQKPASSELTGMALLAYNALEMVVRVAEAARRDQLTGMLTKDAWKAEIDERLQTDEPFGVVFMDMDAFKKVNDTLHHERGDSLIEQFGIHMRRYFRREADALTHERLIQGNDASDTALGRYGGDEFGLIVDLSGGEHRSADPQENMAHTMDYLQSVIDEFVTSQPADIRSLGFDVSLGYAIRDASERPTASELVERADAAMYADKHAHKAVRSR